MLDNEKEQENDNYDIEYKIITLGNAGVGKTSIIQRFVNDDFNENQLSTLGVSFNFKVINVNKKNLKIKLIDTGGQEKYRSISMNYFRNVDVVLFVFDLNNVSSFESIQYWIDLFNDNNNGSHIKMKYLIGNKNDLEQVVEQELIDDLVEKNQITYMSTSARTKYQIDELFEIIGGELCDYAEKKMLENKNKNMNNNDNNNKSNNKENVKNKNQKARVLLQSNFEEPKKKKCCS